MVACREHLAVRPATKRYSQKSLTGIHPTMRWREPQHDFPSEPKRLHCCRCQLYEERSTTGERSFAAPIRPAMIAKSNCSRNWCPFSTALSMTYSISLHQCSHLPLCFRFSSGRSVRSLCPLDANSDPLFQKSITGYLRTSSGGAFFLTLSFGSLYLFPRSTND